MANNAPDKTLVTHSEEWFAKNLEQGVPPALQRLSKAFCRAFNVGGICDPQYVANVAAVELDLGDGRSAFHEGPLPRGFQFDRLAGRLAQSYSFNVKDAGSTVRGIIVSAFLDRVAEPSQSASVEMSQ